MTGQRGKTQKCGLRDRFRKGSLEGFTAAEVVELILSFASPGKGRKRLSANVAARFGGLRGLLDASREELREAGLEDEAALLIGLVKSTAGAYLREKIEGRDVIGNPLDLINYLRAELGGKRSEMFLGVYLSARNEVISMEIIHEGPVSCAVIYPRKVIEAAFRHNARAVIFARSLPDGEPAPSKADYELTRGLERAASAVDIIVHDHIIIGRNAHFSARENGWPSYLPSSLQKASDKSGPR